MQKQKIFCMKIVKLITCVMLLTNGLHAQLTNFGNLYLHPGSSMSVSGTVTNNGAATDLSISGTLQLTGDFTNNGNDLNAAGTGTVVFNGTNTQQINGTQASHFYNVTQLNTGNLLLSNNQLVGNNLVLNAGSLLLNGYTLTVNGGITYATGSLSSTHNSGLILNGAATKSLYFKPGNYLIKTLTVNASATDVYLDDSLHIAGTGDGVLTVNGTLASNGFLSLKSDAGGTARVAPCTGIVFGNVTVERYFPAQRSWRLLTAPLTATQSIFDEWQHGGVYKANEDMLVTGPAPTPANGLDVSPLNNYSMYTWKSSTQTLAGVANTKDSMLSHNAATSADNKGYYVFVRGDRSPSNTNTAFVNTTTLTSTGKLQIGTQVFPANGAAGKYTLIGNPYASPVDFNNVSRTNLVKRFYVMDPSVNEVGGYVMLDDLDNDNNFTKSVAGSPQDNHIQSSQAFFVQTIATAPASLTFYETSKSAVNNLSMFRPSGNNETGMLRASLYVVSGSSTKLADACFVQFNPAFDPAVNYEDALKFGNTNENLALVRNGTTLCAERRPDPVAGDTLFFKFTKSRQLTYRFVIAANSINHAGLQAFLEDTYLSSKTPLNLDENTSVDFAVTADAASAAISRFRIVFELLPAGTLPVRFSGVQAYKINDEGFVKWSVENELNIVNYTIEKSTDGIHFGAAGTVTASNSSSYTWTDGSIITTTCYYRVRSNDVDGSMGYSKIVKLLADAPASSVAVYPNPVTGNVINLRMTNMPAGKYLLQLYSSSGQLVLGKTITYANGTAITAVLQNKLTAGMYHLLLSTPEQQTLQLPVEVQ
jgi:hypothetical protein